MRLPFPWVVLTCEAITHLENCFEFLMLCKSQSQSNSTEILLDSADVPALELPQTASVTAPTPATSIILYGTRRTTNVRIRNTAHCICFAARNSGRLFVTLGSWPKVHQKRVLVGTLEHHQLYFSRPPQPRTLLDLSALYTTTDPSETYYDSPPHSPYRFCLVPAKARLRAPAPVGRFNSRSHPRFPTFAVRHPGAALFPASLRKVSSPRSTECEFKLCHRYRDRSEAGSGVSCVLQLGVVVDVRCRQSAPRINCFLMPALRSPRPQNAVVREYALVAAEAQWCAIERRHCL